MATVKKPIKKAQNGAKTADSTSYFKGRAKDMARQSLYAEAKGDKKLSNVYMDVASKATSDAERQKLKGKPGYDKNGYPLKKKKMQTGGSIGSKVVQENPRQQRRLSRIRETNPERAAKVEKRMVRRADRAMGARGAASRMKTGGKVAKKK